MIRRAMLDDVPELARLGGLFFAESGYADMMPPDPAGLADNLAAFMQAPACHFLVVEVGGRMVGAAGFAILPAFPAPATIQATELFWFMEPEYRGPFGPLLLEAMEEEAAALGAGVISMIALEAARGAVVGRLYERRGYRLVERAYMRRLT